MVLLLQQRNTGEGHVDPQQLFRLTWFIVDAIIKSIAIRVQQLKAAGDGRPVSRLSRVPYEFLLLTKKATTNSVKIWVTSLDLNDVQLLLCPL